MKVLPFSADAIWAGILMFPVEKDFICSLYVSCNRTIAWAAPFKSSNLGKLFPSLYASIHVKTPVIQL